MVKSKKGKITLDEHYELGKYLRIVSDKLTGEYVKIKPKSLARKSKETKVLKLVNELRSILEDIMFRDYGKEGDDKFKKIGGKMFIMEMLEENESGRKDKENKMPCL